jgi:hypothetical protein
MRTSPYCSPAPPRILFTACALALLLSPFKSKAGLFDALGLGTKKTNELSAAAAALPQDQVVAALKEALSNGLQQAVSRLGHENGFLTNLNVKIPMPDKLQKVEKTLRSLKQEKLADEFVETMNRAAEQAVPVAVPVFLDAVKAMTIEDAKAILTGPNDAATQYFRRTTGTNLFERFLPIVKQATDKTGVTSAYKSLMEKAAPVKSLGSFGTALYQAESVDVDAYVTNKALDGLFKLVAEEEKRIRQNPVARTSDLLQTVFGAITKK